MLTNDEVCNAVGSPEHILLTSLLSAATLFSYGCSADDVTGFRHNGSAVRVVKAGWQAVDISLRPLSLQYNEIAFVENNTTQPMFKSSSCVLQLSLRRKPKTPYLQTIIILCAMHIFFNKYSN